jgi:hypothetical protein
MALFRRIHAESVAKREDREDSNGKTASEAVWRQHSTAETEAD